MKIPILFRDLVIFSESLEASNRFFLDQVGEGSWWPARFSGSPWFSQACLKTTHHLFGPFVSTCLVLISGVVDC